MHIVAFFIAFALFLGGIVLMGYSFGTAGDPGLMFFGGIVAVAVSIVIPIHILKRIDG
ncbi:MAG: hypothetical protein ACYCZY_09090 [Lacisediminihabitans sp.]